MRLCKTSCRLATCFMAAALAVPSVEAAPFSWSVLNPLTGPENVSTNGALLEALNFSGGSVADDYDVTINGVTFEGLVNGLDGDTRADSFFPDGVFPTATYFSSDTTRVTASGDDNYLIEEGGLEAFDELLSRRLFAGGNTATLSNLTIGRQYEVQLFIGGTAGPSGVVDNRHIVIDDGTENAFGSIDTTNFGSEMGEDIDVEGGEAQPNPQGFVLTGLFTADAETQVFTISNYRVGSVPGAAFYLPAYQLRDVTTTGALFGDYTNDGLVDAADYTVWRDNLGANVQLTNEDPSQTPGMVTSEDYTVWASSYGAGSPSAALAAATPEPSALVLATCLAAGAIGATRKR